MKRTSRGVCGYRGSSRSLHSLAALRSGRDDRDLELRADRQAHLLQDGPGFIARIGGCGDGTADHDVSGSGRDGFGGVTTRL